MAKEHTELENKIKACIELRGYEVIKHKQGGGYGRRYAPSEPGIADMQAIKKGVHTWIEVKTPNDIQKKDQKIFQLKVESVGDNYILAYSVQDVIEQLEDEIVEITGCERSLLI